MNVQFKTAKLRKTCSSYSLMKKEYGESMARKITQRIQELTAADSIQFMLDAKIGRCHALNHDRLGQYALDLVHPFRLVFTELPPDSAVIIEIVDYH